MFEGCRPNGTLLSRNGFQIQSDSDLDLSQTDPKNNRGLLLTKRDVPMKLVGCKPNVN